MLDVPTETVHKLVDDVHRATVLNYDSLVLEGDAESFIAGDDAGPEDTILDRERKAYLIDAVHALPERLQRVVIGYFFEERSMQELADELGVSESRISQLRAEALLLLKDGINSQLEPEADVVAHRAPGQQPELLEHHRYAVAAQPPQRRGIAARDVDDTVAVVEQHAATSDGVEPVGGPEQRRLAGAGQAHQHRDVAARDGETGIRDADDARRLADAGYDGILVGETLVRAEDRAAALRTLVGHPVAPR